MNRVVVILKNKYIISSTFFVLWMLFFDRNDLMSQYQYWNQLKKLEAEKSFYTKEIKTIKKDLNELNTNPIMLEKFAREKYLMKKENEDLFVIVNTSESK
ncbi:MAG: septum formation initiator family protein [Pedobacter sp.]|nr:MAG: septum formation initiator family protein [Pedobacter sp.]